MVHSTHAKRAALIDRDGVINHLVDRGEGFCLGGKPFRFTAPFNIQELRLKPDVREALELIGQKGYMRILVTNQPDVATGNIPIDEFRRIMNVFRLLPFDGLCICMHHPKANCTCRKPAPGMLYAARDLHNLDLTASYMIGDMETDVQAGKAAGTHTMRVTDSPLQETDADQRVYNLMEAAMLLP